LFNKKYGLMKKLFALQGARKEVKDIFIEVKLLG
jgi:hypothetical protein